jgi:hypothetical protein
MNFRYLATSCLSELISSAILGLLSRGCEVTVWSGMRVVFFEM